MTPSIKLSGNLGERHRSFNTLVHEAYLQKTPLQVHENPDEPALDRLFRIDLASKQKNVEYIIYNLKDDDMLYVSRALKSLWLLDPDYSEIINPGFLENDLFPHMILSAVNKMRHWLQINLRDPQRCNEFYQFYKERNFDIAAKFLWHCSNEYILCEISGILDRVTPKLLKRLSEKVPQVTKIYYDSLKQNEKLLKYYLEKDSEFMLNIKHLLKSDPNVFFYILENFFVHEKFKPLSCNITKYIMKHHKTRFIDKSELYTAWYLNMKLLSENLNSEEIKDVVLKLARAEYLKPWFSYQAVEPLIKRLGKNERAAFKKLVFVDKDIGETIKEWPYPIPNAPELKTPQTSLFDDHDINDDDFEYEDYCLMSADCGYSLKCANKGNLHKRKPTQTLLDQLFDKYRFSNYKQTYNELRNRIRAVSSSQNREFMLLVLVSKTGGKVEDLISLLDLMSQFKNEPVHIRAAIVRSLVKRASLWRLPAEHWSKLLEWGHGLGLDGSTPEAECNEGLHAVVIRDLLADSKPSQAVWDKFLSDFNTLREYSLNADERICIRTRLPALLLNDALSDKEKLKLNQLELLLDTLEAYNVRFDYFPGIIDATALAVKNYWIGNDDALRSDTERLLNRLYTAKVARKELIKEYFETNQTESSYVNALRHDITILDNTGKLEKLIDANDLKHEAFFRKLALYFMEEGGLGERYRAVIEHRAASEPNKTEASFKDCHSDSFDFVKPNQNKQKLARPLTMLSGSNFKLLLKPFDEAPPKTAERRMASELKANAHLVRPVFDINSFGWRKVGAKAVTNRLSICRQNEIERYLTETLSWRRTLRLALVLAKRVKKDRDAFEIFASKRPGAAFQAALKYFHREGDNSDVIIWEMVKSHISKAESKQLRSYVESARTVPAAFRGEYCFLVYLANKIHTRDIEIELEILSMIPAVLVELDEKYIFDANDDFLKDYFPVKVVDKQQSMFSNSGITRFYIKIIARFLVLSSNEEMMEKRLHKIGIPFLNHLELSLKQNLTLSKDRKDLPEVSYLEDFVLELKYNKAYFDAKYVSCLPVFEKITEWMLKLLPAEKWFDKYVSLNLTVFYFKAARLCLEQNPEFFSEDSRKIEGAQILGTTFAKFISTEIEEFNNNYFPSITKLYTKNLVNYFNSEFCCTFDESVQNFVIAVLNELIRNKLLAPCLIARSVFKEFGGRLKPEQEYEILNKFKKTEVKELCFAVDLECA